MSGVSDWLFGSPDKLKKIDTGTKEQQALHNNMLSQAMNMSAPGGGYNQAQQYYNNLLGPNQQQAFDQFSSPYMQQFQEQMLPQIAERFAGAGALSSSGFGQALGGAGAGLQSQLAQLFSQLQGQAAGAQTNQFNQLSQQGLNYQPFAYQQQQGSGGMLNSALSSLLSSALPGLVSAGASGIDSLFKAGSSGGVPAHFQWSK